MTAGMVIVVITLAIGFALVASFAWFIDAVCKYQERIDSE